MLIRLPYRWICVLIFFVATCSCHISLGFWFFSCPHGNGQGRVGDVCSAFCRCHPLNTCEAGVQKCARPGEYGERCHATKPCGSGLTCQPGVQKCFHVPRRHGEPCVAGYECGADLSCEPGVQRCYHHPRLYNEPCSAGFSCSSGLSCQPGYQRCLHHPRRENERCSAGYSCADGLVCRLCDKPFATCQLGRVPALTEQDYGRPFNKVAFLVTHNSFSNSPSFAVWVRNQRFSVRQQLEDGVRGLMLDIYPGWGEADVRLCHASCFWGGSTNLLDTLIEIRKFLESNEREVITIVFEDYLRNPVILKRVFDQAGLSSHVLRIENWGDGFNDWPTLTDMRRLGRLVVFNNNGLNRFPYTEFNMWHYVRENRYGNAGLNKKECIDRPESRWNKAWNDHWSLVLINWFSTAANPLQPCLNSFAEIKNKLTTCYDKFGFWANFVAVDFYTAGSGGGAFQAVKWLNKKFREGGASADRKKASPLPFPPSDTVSHSQTNKSSLLETRTKNPADEPGYGSGFHDLSDIIAHILQNKNRWFTKKSNVSKTLKDIMSADGSYLNSSRVSDAVSSQSHKRKDWATRKNNAGNKEKIFPANIVTSTYSNIQSSENYGSKRTALVIDNDVDSRNWNSTPRSNHTNHKQNTQDFLSKVHPYLKNDQSNHAFSGTTDKTGNIPRVRPRNLTSQGEVFHVGPQGKVARLANFTGRHSRFPPSALRSKKNMAVKLRNLRRQLARLKLKLNKYIHSAHIGTKKKVKHNTLNILGKVRKAPLNFSSS